MSGPRRLPGGIPIPVLVIGLPVVGVLAVLLLTRLHGTEGLPPQAVAVRSADLILEDAPDGSVDVLAAGDRHVVDVLAPETNAFLRVLLAGLVRERRREGEGAPSVPFHLTRWSDGRLTIDDLATHKLIELNAFGPTNEAVFARLLALSAGNPKPGG